MARGAPQRSAINETPVNPTFKAFLIAVPVAILVQALLILFAVAQFGDKANFQLLTFLGIGTGLVSFSVVKKRFQKPESD